MHYADAGSPSAPHDPHPKRTQTKMRLNARPTPRLHKQKKKKEKKRDQNALTQQKPKRNNSTPLHLLLLTLALIHRKNTHGMPQRLRAGPRTHIHHAALRRPAPALPRLAARARRVRPPAHLVSDEPVGYVRPRLGVGLVRRRLAGRARAVAGEAVGAG